MYVSSPPALDHGPSYHLYHEHPFHCQHWEPAAHNMELLPLPRQWGLVWLLNGSFSKLLCWFNYLQVPGLARVNIFSQHPQHTRRLKIWYATHNYCKMHLTSIFNPIPSFHSDARLHQSPVVPGLPASVLVEVSGVGVAAADAGYAPDRRCHHPFPELWCGRTSAVQHDLPGLHPCCGHRGAYPLPQPHRAQMERWVHTLGCNVLCYCYVYQNERQVRPCIVETYCDRLGHQMLNGSISFQLTLEAVRIPQKNRNSKLYQRRRIKDLGIQYQVWLTLNNESPCCYCTCNGIALKWPLVFPCHPYTGQYPGVEFSPLDVIKSEPDGKSTIDKHWHAWTHRVMFFKSSLRNSSSYYISMHVSTCLTLVN